MRALRKSKNLVWSCVLLLAPPAIAGDLASDVRQCGVQSVLQASGSSDEIGGRHITASGTLRVLLVFVSFPDDETPNPDWPAHSPPLFMRQFIDPDTTTSSGGPFNLTNYFNQMSLGQFHLVGDVLWVETAHSKAEYANGSFGRANWSVLQETVGPLVDFSQYDHWTNHADYQNENVPDSLVDMIVMVWRTNIFEYVGEASLGDKTGFILDGKKIEMGFPERIGFPLGSGVTCEYLYNDPPEKVMRTMAHELGHWLLGGAHPYNGNLLSGKHQYWGILCSGERVSSCANAYEREKLGWIQVPLIRPDSTALLSDYLTAGDALKYHPVNGDTLEYFYLENHQNVSVFDDVTANPADRGVWILHQQGPYMEMDNLRIRPSDGNWNWENPGFTSACFSQQLPIFRRGTPGVLTGPSHRDQIPTSMSAVNWMFEYTDATGKVNCGSFFAGQMFSGAFNRTTNNVFSAFSNPNSNTWENKSTSFTLEIVNEVNGIITVRYHSDSSHAPPARRYLGANPIAQGVPEGWLPLAWGTQWTEGQGMEANVDWAELERQVGNGGSWTPVYQGAAMSWTDGSLVYGTSGTVPVHFRVKVRNTHGDCSVWSNVYSSTTDAVTGVAGSDKDKPAEFLLATNYPNPFNPETIIHYQIPVDGFVSLRVYDLLGSEVATMVNERQLAGSYTVKFPSKGESTSGLASGVYIYRLTSGSFVASRKMLLIR